MRRDSLYIIILAICLASCGATPGPKKPCQPCATSSTDGSTNGPVPDWTAPEVKIPKALARAPLLGLMDSDKRRMAVQIVGFAADKALVSYRQKGTTEVQTSPFRYYLKK